MTHRRSWCGLSVVLVSACLVRAALAEGRTAQVQERIPAPGQVVLNRLTAVQEGKLILPEEGRQGGKDRKVPIRAEARLIFEQYPLAAGKRDARYLSDAAVGVLVQGRKTVRTMRPSVRLIAASLRDGQLFFYSPTGPLTYEELQMLQYPLDPLAFGQLVGPGGMVSEGKSWPLSDKTVQALMRFDAVERQDVKVVCESVTEDVVKLRIAGTAVGTFAIAPARLTLNVAVEFDRSKRLYRRVSAELYETKSPGPVEPGFEGTIRITLERSIRAGERLTKELIASVPERPPVGLDYLVYEHPEGKFRLYYPRRWRVHFADRSSLILKWIDSKGLVAQCNAVLGHKGSPGTHLKPAEIREQVFKALGKGKGQLLEERELTGQKGLWIYRMALAGVVGKEAVVWHYYTIADRSGQHLLVVFSVPASRSKEFGAADLEIVQSIQMPAGSPAGSDRVSRRGE